MILSDLERSLELPSTFPGPIPRKVQKISFTKLITVQRSLELLLLLDTFRGLLWSRKLLLFTNKWQYFKKGTIICYPKSNASSASYNLVREIHSSV